MTEKQLDLLKLTTGRSAELGAGAPQVMRCQGRNARYLGILPKHLPDYFLAQSFTSHLLLAVHGPKNVAVYDPRRVRPSINRYLHPDWYGRRADPAVLSNEIHDAPAAIALLYMCECERRNLGPSEATAEQNRQHGSIPQSLYRGDIRSTQQILGLLQRQPVPDPNSRPFHALYAHDRSSQPQVGGSRCRLLQRPVCG